MASGNESDSLLLFDRVPGLRQSGHRLKSVDGVGLQRHRLAASSLPKNVSPYILRSARFPLRFCISEGKRGPASVPSPLALRSPRAVHTCPGLLPVQVSSPSIPVRRVR